MRKEFELSHEQLETLLNASKHVPYMVAGGVPPQSPQARVNTIWAAFGQEMGFKFLSVKPVPDKSDMFFTAEVA